MCSRPASSFVAVHALREVHRRSSNPHDSKANSSAAANAEAADGPAAHEMPLDEDPSDAAGCESGSVGSDPARYSA
jgi:hypothetical protein